jgi:beta-xylosidase
MYYFYFPARDKDGIFRIGVASGTSPTGPFAAEEDYIQGTFSIDPAVYEDDDGSYYLYFGGLWGGQLQNWYNGQFNTEDKYPGSGNPALPAKVAKLSANMLELDEEVKDVVVIDEHGDSITVDDNNRRFFEGPWVHKHNGVYYFSYSTGDTHKIAYATGSSPYGPFTYQGVILNPVLGWTNHHSITFFEGKWYLFYHDSSLSRGKTHLRCVKMTELVHDENGFIEAIDAYQK